MNLTVSDSDPFDTDRFRREGRLHVENGYSLFEYVGAIFNGRDFQAGNEKRLKEKLDTVIDFEERFRRYEAEHPGERYFLADVMNAYPSPDISDDARARRRAELAGEIQGKLAAHPAPEDALPQERVILDYLSRLPAGAQKWLFEHHYDIAFSAEKKTAAGGKEHYDYEGMLAPHPAAREHTGGGALAAYRFDDGAIHYVYSTPCRDPLALLAHEALGHGLFNQVLKTGRNAFLYRWESAVVADLGDVNKIAAENPAPNNGRLGALMEILATTRDEGELLTRLRQFDPGRVPDFSSEEKARAWLADVRAIAEDSWPKLGPKSWTYMQSCYRHRDGSYDHDMTLKELGAIVGEQYFSTALGKQEVLAFVIPALTEAWRREMMPLLEPQRADGKSWQGAHSGGTGWKAAL